MPRGGLSLCRMRSQPWNCSKGNTGSQAWWAQIHFEASKNSTILQWCLLLRPWRPHHYQLCPHLSLWQNLMVLADGRRPPSFSGRIQDVLQSHASPQKEGYTQQIFVLPMSHTWLRVTPVTLSKNSAACLWDGNTLSTSTITPASAGKHERGSHSFSVITMA